MLPTREFFKKIECPFYNFTVKGSCNRPHCHFKHSRRDADYDFSDPIIEQIPDPNELNEKIDEDISPEESEDEIEPLHQNRDSYSNQNTIGDLEEQTVEDEGGGEEELQEEEEPEEDEEELQEEEEELDEEETLLRFKTALMHSIKKVIDTYPKLFCKNINTKDFNHLVDEFIKNLISYEEIESVPTKKLTYNPTPIIELRKQERRIKTQLPYIPECVKVNQPVLTDTMDIDSDLKYLEDLIQNDSLFSANNETVDDACVNSKEAMEQCEDDKDKSRYKDKQEKTREKNSKDKSKSSHSHRHDLNKNSKDKSSSSKDEKSSSSKEDKSSGSKEEKSSSSKEEKNSSSRNEKINNSKEEKSSNSKDENSSSSKEDKSISSKEEKSIGSKEEKSISTKERHKSSSESPHKRSSSSKDSRHGSSSSRPKHSSSHKRSRSKSRSTHRSDTKKRKHSSSRSHKKPEAASTIVISSESSDDDDYDAYMDVDDERDNGENLVVNDNTSPKLDKADSKEEKYDEPDYIRKKKKQRIAHVDIFGIPNNPAPVPVHAKVLNPNDRFKQIQEKYKGLHRNAQSKPPDPPNAVKISHVPNVNLMLSAKKSLTQPSPTLPSINKNSLLMNDILKRTELKKTIAQTSKKSSRVAHVPPSGATASKPMIQVGGKGTRIPLVIRQTCLDRIFALYSKYVPPDLASDRAVQVEMETYEKCHAAKSYQNSIANSILRIRKEQAGFFMGSKLS